jgi:GntR family transcriptional regulator, transcriptional repressor for pyruvate dehydrogenase complex
VAFQLHTIDREKLYTAIVDQILEGIRSGAYSPRSALPAERTLAAQLGVSRASLREAIRVLEHAGVLDVRTGSGTFVSDDGLSKGASLRARAVLVGEHSPLDVLAARRALEPVCAEHAAMHRNARDLEVLWRAFEDHARSEEGSDDWAEADLDFHLAIARATHNPVLVMLVDRLVEIMRQKTWAEFRVRQLQHAGRGGDYIEQHRAIFVALERHDRAIAGQRMYEHLDAVEAGLLAEV